MQGHTCLDLAGTVTARSAEKGSFDMLEAGVPQKWLAELQGHSAVASVAAGSMDPIAAPLVLEGSKLFLGRWRQQEIEVAMALRARGGAHASWCATSEITKRIETFVTARAQGLHEAQLHAVRVGATRRLAVITGGPGTGKTFVAARIIEAVLEAGPQPVLLLAPTGKAAARLQHSVRDAAVRDTLTPRAVACIEGLQAQTVHAATMRRGGEALRRARLIVVDETSMIDLERMHALLRLAHEDATILMLGDPHQLASVEAGSVLADIVHGTEDARHALSACVARLVKSHRFPDGGAVARLAAAVNGNRADEVMEILRAKPDTLDWKSAGTPAEVVRATMAALGEGATALPRVLCGHRHGPDGAIRINAAIEQRRGVAGQRGLYQDRPILITVNDDLTGLRNGDTGHLAKQGDAWMACIDGGSSPVEVSRLPAHETAFALTIHKTQGSEYESVVVALPARPSPVLTRELLYTGITRTKGAVTVVGSELSIRAAIGRPIVRSSGLRERLSGS
jgi:exodeoxyribonuclease V alpha subunit